MDDKELIERLRDDFISDVIFSIDTKLSKTGLPVKFLIVAIHFFNFKLNMRIKLNKGMSYKDIKQNIYSNLLGYIDKKYEEKGVYKVWG